MKLNAAHQTKFVVKPPNRATISTGKFWKSGRAPDATAASAMGLPAAKAKAMHELMMPGEHCHPGALDEAELGDGRLFLGVRELPLLPHAGQPAHGDAREANPDAQDDD